MSKPEYDTAAEFCSLAKAPDLLEYLKTGSNASAEEVREKLKKRRKYMQGMQSNPKYRSEALFLIKHFAALSRALENPLDYQRDAQQRAEAVHLPILEMTIKGVLAGGTLTGDQDNYLKRNANELGVSDATFEQLMNRLCSEAGIERSSQAQPVHRASTLPPIPVETGEDYYTLLGIDARASSQEIEQAFQARMSESTLGEATPETEAHQVRLRLAHKVLSDPRARAQYKVNQTRTGPPARQRQAAPSASGSHPPPFGRGTAPAPVRGTPTPGASRLEILGDPRRTIDLRRERDARIRIRNRGTDPMSGRISSDDPWVMLSQSHILPDQPEQSIEVNFDPNQVPAGVKEGTVRITTDRGESATITYQLTQRSNAGLAMAGVFLVGILSIGGWAAGMFERPIDVKFVVEPMAAEFLLNGVSKGSGSNFEALSVPRTPQTIVVHHPNFQTLNRTLSVAELAEGPIHLNLVQTRKMDFKPTDDLKKGNLNQLEAQSVVGKRSAAFKGCIQPSVPPGEVLEGRIRIHIENSGLAAGISIDGEAPDDPKALECIERQAAAVQLSPISDGDYATVSYKYAVKGTTDGT